MKRMRILVFEFITGGGFSQSELPPALAQEGLLMLQALLADLAEIETVEIDVMLDARLLGKVNAANVSNIHPIGAKSDWEKIFARLIQQCDAVWPIAPETDGILVKLCQEVEKSGKFLLSSASEAVAIASDKWSTYQQLSQHKVATAPTYCLEGFGFSNGEWIIKSKDGVGCEDSYLISNQSEFDRVIAKLEVRKFIIQPHIYGRKTSLSCLFKDGRFWLLTVNLQIFSVINQHYQLDEITVNLAVDVKPYLAILGQLALALPGLWGYVGIDLIETEKEILLLEINPRLTSSYAGIRAATGINCAQAVVNLLSGDPQIKKTINQPINLKIKQ